MQWLLHKKRGGELLQLKICHILHQRPVLSRALRAVRAMKQLNQCINCKLHQTCRKPCVLAGK